MNLVERLYEEHNGINAKIERLYSVVETLNDSSINTLKKLFEELNREILIHLREEEELLFPELAKKMGTSATSLQLILKEHEEIKNLLKEINNLILEGNKPKIFSAVHSLNNKLEDHLKKENNLLYSIAHEFIDPETLKEKSRLAVKIRQNINT